MANKKNGLGWNLQDDGSYISGSTEDRMTPHKYKNRKHIYISSKDGLMYEDMYKGKRESPSFLGIVQKMTVLQELESFRRMSGTVAMTSRSRGRIPQPSDKTLSKESE